MILRHRLKFFRNRACLTQAQLADQVNLSLSHYARLERAHDMPFGPSSMTAALLCKVLHAKFEDLFYLEDENA